MYTVLKRLQYFADIIGLDDVYCVFDQACYAKACQVIGASPQQFLNVGCWLGAFHTIYVLMLAIFKRFGEAGLIDIVTESNIVAAGSLN